VGGPSWLAGILAAIMIVTAAYCASRLVLARAQRRPAGRDVDLVHTVMGVAMAGMLVSWLNPLPDRLWAGMFAGGTAWFGWRAWGGRRARVTAAGHGRPAHRHAVPHFVMCGAMVYMLLAVRAAGPGPGPAMAGPAAAGRFPLLALVFALFMVGYVMWQADRLPAVARATPAPGPGTGSGAGPATAPGVAPPDQAPGVADSGVAGPDQAGRPGRAALSPGLAACCQIAMGVTMGYMLIGML
jgi:hypothetical protein